MEEVFTQTSRSKAIIINADAIRNNMKVLKSLAGPQTEVMAVVKGGAYGNGVLQAVEEVLKVGAKELAVANVGEGVYLRKAGVDVPISILGEAW